MELGTKVGGRGRLVSTILTAVLAAVAIGSFRRGKRLNGVLAAVSAVALGYNATAGSRDLKEDIGIDTASEDGELRCSVCGQPIRTGQPRGPNADDEIVHLACEERLTER